VIDLGDYGETGVPSIRDITTVTSLLAVVIVTSLLAVVWRRVFAPHSY